LGDLDIDERENIIKTGTSGGLCERDNKFSASIKVGGIP
jgi:hypothetical protein